MNIDWTNEVGVFLTVIGSLILAYGGLDLVLYYLENYVMPFC